MATDDFISNLPDEVLARIISGLPAIEAIRTTILSKRLKDVWRNVFRLDFDPKGVKKLSPRKQAVPAPNQRRSTVPVIQFGSNVCHDDGDDFDDTDKREEIARVVKNIDNVLLSHERNLISCRIVHLSNSYRNGDLEKWIKYLTSEKEVQELAFLCDDYQHEFHPKSLFGLGLNLPSGIFSCRTLQSLEFTNYDIRFHRPFHHCHNLKTLKLYHCDISTETLEAIVSSCGFMEHLSVCSSTSSLKQVRIFSQTVKTVELESLDLEGIYLSTQSLGALVLHSMKFPAKSMVIHAPNLRVFTATRKPITKNPYNFTRPSKQTKIAEILEYCTHLLESRSEIEEATRNYSSVNNRLPYPETKLWEQRELCDCITFTLRHVSIKGFNGKDGEMEFPRHLITKCAKLERLEIWCNHDWSSEGGKATLGLLSLPRSSIDVSILLKPPPNLLVVLEDGSQP
ncbi:putative F-box protein At1g67390 isoform X3 [Gossypium hirsutum]|uniref:F-box protein At1g67390 isoform X3 n=1 Tax=Gossypium hirsutum TaxID=3635 RepID=A0ABM3BIK4_GOSHI|nr:putative F-box protein At1g67390 isoform X3 [Gossypium hirsutum]XP_040966890.1 putative F-box protein At1g67390 isoform X3 [Gossypium hirsutum]